jgi:hypothetical protein
MVARFPRQGGSSCQSREGSRALRWVDERALGHFAPSFALGRHGRGPRLCCEQ